MSTNWMAINAGLKAGIDTWNQFGWLRQAGQDAQIASDTKDAQASAQTDIDNYKTAAREAKDYNNSDFGKLATAFGVDANDKEAQDRFRNQAIEGGWMNQNDNSVNWDKVNEQYGVQRPQSTSGIPAVDDDEAAYGGNSNVQTPRWKQDIANNISNRDQTAQAANKAIDKDLVNSTKLRIKNFGNQAAEIRKSSDRWWNRDRLSEDDGYGTSAGFKFLGEQLDKGDPEALSLMADVYNAGAVNGERISLNENGTFTLRDGQGNIIQENFTPSKVQLGDQLARVYNLNKFFETGKLQDYISGKAGLAQADSAVAASRVNNMKARAAETYGMSNAAAENASNNAEAAINVDKADISNKTKDGVIAATNKTNDVTTKYAEEEAKAKLRALQNKANGVGSSGGGSGGGRGSAGAASGDGYKYVDRPDGKGQNITLANGRIVASVDANGGVHAPGDPEGKQTKKAFNRMRNAYGDVILETKWDPNTNQYAYHLANGEWYDEANAKKAAQKIVEKSKLPDESGKGGKAEGPKNTKPRTAIPVAGDDL